MEGRGGEGRGGEEGEGRWVGGPPCEILNTPLSTTKVELTTVADCQSSLHRLVTSIDCMSLHSGLRDSRRSGGG